MTCIYVYEPEYTLSTKRLQEASKSMIIFYNSEQRYRCRKTKLRFAYL